MILDVVKVQQVEQEEKPTLYKVTLKGSDVNYVKMTLTIEGEMKSDISRYVPLMVGERRRIEFDLLNRTLSDYEGGIGEAVEIEDMVEKRRQAAKEAGV